jgi:hypothetical protein
VSRGTKTSMSKMLGVWRQVARWLAAMAGGSGKYMCQQDDHQTGDVTRPRRKVKNILTYSPIELSWNLKTFTRTCLAKIEVDLLKRNANGQVPSAPWRYSKAPFRAHKS